MALANLEKEALETCRHNRTYQIAGRRADIAKLMRFIARQENDASGTGINNASPMPEAERAFYNDERFVFSGMDMRCRRSACRWNFHANRAAGAVRLRSRNDDRHFSAECIKPLRRSSDSGRRPKTYNRRNRKSCNLHRFLLAGHFLCR